MRTTFGPLALAAASALTTFPALAGAKNSPCKPKPYVTSEALQELVTLDGLLAGSQKLQDIADANGGNRAFGGGGHNATVDWLVEELEATGYYDVYKQPFTERFAGASGTLSANGAAVAVKTMTYTPGGTFAGVPLVAVANQGCDATADFPAEVSGAVALVLRGTCSFAEKTTNAATAGAVAVLIYNNAVGEVSGTLGAESPDFVPSLGISDVDGAALLAELEKGPVAIDIDVLSVLEDRVNYNVIAESKGGDHNNVLMIGGHSDSVFAGPGINDDGSGTVGVLTVAKALTHFTTKNAVRLGFWGAEEFGKLGSYFYVKSLNSTETEVNKIRAYLNFDMIASPNYILGIYDGDGSAFNFSGPAGSDKIEAGFETFFESKGKGHVPSEFTGRSDYAAFIENGIPSGGLFTGAEVLKTEAEATLFGGAAGEAYDANYHAPGDNIENLNHDAFLLNAHAIADAVAAYATSFDALPPVQLQKRRWDADHAQFFKRQADKGHVHAAHSGPCGGGDRY